MCLLDLSLGGDQGADRLLRHQGGISMLVMGLAIVLAPHGIRVNAILPSAILTDMSGPLLAPDSHRDGTTTSASPWGARAIPTRLPARSPTC